MNGNYYSMWSLFWGFIGIMENEMETTVVYQGVYKGYCQLAVSQNPLHIRVSSTI